MDKKYRKKTIVQYFKIINVLYFYVALYFVLIKYSGQPSTITDE